MAFLDKYLQPGKKPLLPQMSTAKVAPQMSTPKPQAPAPIKPQNMGGLLNLPGPTPTSYGNNALKQPTNIFAKPVVTPQPAPQMSVAPKPTSGYGGTLNPNDPAAIGGAAMQAKNDALRRSQGQIQASSGPVVDQKTPTLPPPPTQNKMPLPDGYDTLPRPSAASGGDFSAPDSLLARPREFSTGSMLARPRTNSNGWTGETLLSYPPQYVYQNPDGSKRNVSEEEHKRLQGGAGTESSTLGTMNLGSSGSQIDALRRKYLESLGMSPDEIAAQSELSGISSQAAQESARARQEYSDRIKAIQDQATLQPFLTGRQIQASGQLTNQLEALQAATEAQTMPLQSRLATLQAQRELEQKRREAELGFAQSDREAEQVTPVEVGGRLVNPRTGEIVYSPPAESAEGKTFTLSPGQKVFDAQGNIIASNDSAGDKLTTVSAGSTVIDSMGNVIYRAPSADEIAAGGGASSAAIETLNGKLQLIDGLLNSRGMAGSVGPYGVARWTPFSADAAARQDFAAGVNQLIAKDTMDVLLNLKKQGGTLGALSDQERILLQSAASKIGTWMQRDKNGNPTGKFEISEDLFKKELQTIRDLTESALQRAGGGGGGGSGDELDQMLDQLGFDKLGRDSQNALRTLTIGKRSVRAATPMALRLARAAKDFKAATGKDLQINQDFRSHEEQARLYKELSAKGARVAPPGQSFHEKGLAIDVTNWQEAQPFFRRYGLYNDLPDDRGHFSLGETRKIG